jgi:hypothetical protein
MRSDAALLIISMKLLLWKPSSKEPDSKHSLYNRARQFRYEIEASGVGSVQFLQASVFIALYEFAHGIYPAAFLSIGACARLGMAFGFDRMESEEQSWIELEERKRAWWAVLILDRYSMHLPFDIEKNTDNKQCHHHRKSDQKLGHTRSGPM